GALLDALNASSADAALPLNTYARLLASLPADAVARVLAAWGEPADDPDLRDGAFRLRARAFGNILVALAPDRGRSRDRRAACRRRWCGPDCPGGRANSSGWSTNTPRPMVSTADGGSVSRGSSSRPPSAPALRTKPASAPTSVPTRRCAASMLGSATSRTSPS